MNSALFVVVLITGLALVGAALLIAGLISPRSFNPQKGEAYECGIPSRGESWMQFKVGYYLFAILYLMFDKDVTEPGGYMGSPIMSGIKFHRANAVFHKLPELSAQVRQLEKKIEQLQALQAAEE